MRDRMLYDTSPKGMPAKKLLNLRMAPYNQQETMMVIKKKRLDEFKALVRNF